MIAAKASPCRGEMSRKEGDRRITYRRKPVALCGMADTGLVMVSRMAERRDSIRCSASGGDLAAKARALSNTAEDLTRQECACGGWSIPGMPRRPGRPGTSTPAWSRPRSRRVNGITAVEPSSR
jgi:hypothetical protein